MQQLALTYVCTISNKIQPLGKKVTTSFCSSMHARPLLVYQLSKDPELWSAAVRKKGAKIMYFAVDWTQWTQPPVTVTDQLGRRWQARGLFLRVFPRITWSVTRGRCAATPGVSSGLGKGTLHCYIHLKWQKSSPTSENTAWTRGDTTAAYIPALWSSFREGKKILQTAVRKE